MTSVTAPPTRGSPDEDRRGGFERGGWVTPLFDNEAITFLNQVYQRADAFLYGRRTYEIFAGSWGAVEDPGINPIAGALNTQPKYVASTTPSDPKWANTTVLSGDVAAAIGELKAKPAGELQVHGSDVLVRWLQDNDLVDELKSSNVTRPSKSASDSKTTSRAGEGVDVLVEEGDLPSAVYESLRSPGSSMMSSRVTNSERE